MLGASKLAGEDDYILGVAKIDGHRFFVYDREELLEYRTKLLMDEDPTLKKPEAWADVHEDYLYNTVDSWDGDQTPAYLDTSMDAETAAEMFDGSLGPSPEGYAGFLGIVERTGMDPSYAFDVETEYRPVDGQTVMYVDTETDLSEWLDE